MNIPTTYPFENLNRLTISNLERSSRFALRDHRRARAQRSHRFGRLPGQS